MGYLDAVVHDKILTYCTSQIALAGDAFLEATPMGFFHHHARMHLLEMKIEVQTRFPDKTLCMSIFYFGLPLLVPFTHDEANPFSHFWVDLWAWWGQIIIQDFSLPDLLRSCW